MSLPSTYLPSRETIRDHLQRVRQTALLPYWERHEPSLQLLLGLRDAEVDDALRQTAPCLNPAAETEYALGAVIVAELVADPSVQRVLRVVRRTNSALALGWLTPTPSEVEVLVADLGGLLREPRWFRMPVIFASLCDLVVRFGAPAARAALRELELAPVTWLERLSWSHACGEPAAAPQLVAEIRPAWAPEASPAVTRDALTGLLGRAVLTDDVHRDRSARAGALRARLPAPGVIVLDVDHMKKILDVHGYRPGDAVLVTLAGHLQALFGDRVVRLGGDEFLVLWEHEGLAAVAEAAVASIRTLRIPLEGAAEDSLAFTVSAGVASGADLTAVVHAAEDALGRAKDGGRDRVEIA